MQLVCPSCGARNPSGARWCGQCYRAFEEPEPPASPSTPEPPQDERPPPRRAPSGPATPPPPPRPEPEAPPGRARSGTWVCPACEHPNPEEASACEACGTGFFAAYGYGRGGRPAVGPAEAAGWSLVFPGVGHAKAGQGVLGIAIGLLTGTTIAFGLLLAVGPGEGALGALLFLAAAGLWGVAALDAYRWARGEESEVLLRPRVVSIVAGLVLLVFLAGLGRALGGMIGGGA